jgi:predicted  nucleic acid-binding Zn-ribbon protein
MNVFDIKESIINTTETIAFLEELLAQQKQLSALQKELEAALLDASKFDPLDHESARIQERIDDISNQLVDLIQYKAEGSALKSRDLIPVLLQDLDANVNTLVSVHCGVPQSCTHCGLAYGDVFIC